VLPNKQKDRASDAAAGIETQKGGFGAKQVIGSVIAIVAAFCIIHFVFKVDFWGSLIYGMTLVGPLAIITDTSLTKVEKSRLTVIIIIMLFVIFFWMCFEQAGASLTFFANEQTNRRVFGWEMPASYFQSFNPIFIVILAPIFAGLWGRLGRSGVEPPAPMKQAMGLGFLALGFLFISFGATTDPTIKVSIMWLTGLYFLHTVGELFLSPIGLSMVNKLTPGRFTSLMMGIWFLAIATGNKLAGTMSSLYPDPNATGPKPVFLGITIDNLHTYFMIFVGFSGAAAIILFLLSFKLKKMMHGVK
jgi:POT family proton-dependent oligopeptide transporter